MIHDIKVAQDEQNRRFLQYIGDIQSALNVYSNFIELDGLTDIKQNFQKKVEDFYDENRKFNIAVIGQVKAGKSSFLNALLFNGEAVLPYASTPKTSTLTMVEHSEQNRLCVEFYDVFEWAQLKKTARSTLDTQQTHAARDLMEMAQNSTVSMNECFEIGRQDIAIQHISDFNELLEEYVGEKGRYTPFVKSVTIKADIPDIKNISIVDTPGLNDPVPSRRVKTQEFIERCDAAFFLSRASYFLDSNDMALISSQLPQKGIKKLVLIGSQYDNALMDALRDGDNYRTVDSDLRAALFKRAKKTIGLMSKQLADSGCSAQVIDVVNECQKPYFISVVANRMLSVPPERYSELEHHVGTQLEQYMQLHHDTLSEVSGFEVVRGLFSDMVSQKNELLVSKAASFAVVANSELKQYLHGKNIELQQQMHKIKGEFLPKWDEDIRRVTGEINDIKALVDTAFEECYGAVEQLAYDNASGLFDSLHSIKPTVKTGIDVVNIGVDVNDSMWWNPFSWRKTHKEYITRQKAYRYCDVNDVLEEMKFIEDGTVELYKGLRADLLSADSLKERLVKDLLPLANASGLDIGHIIGVSLDRLTMPHLQTDFSEQRQQLTKRFGTGVVDEEHSQQLLDYSQQLIKSMTDATTAALLKNVRMFSVSVKRANEHMCHLLLDGYYTKQAELTQQQRQATKTLRTRVEATEVISRYL